MKKIPNWLVILIAIGLLVASKFIFFSRPEDKTASKGKTPQAITVNYFVVKPSSFTNQVFVTGKIGAFKQIDVLPETAGKITEIYCREGEAVNRGSLLAELNDADIQAQLLKLKAQIKLSQLKLDRVRKLLEINGVSQEEFETQENELSTLKAEESYLLAQLAKTLITAPFDGVVGLKNISEGSFVTTSTTLFSLIQTKPLYVEFSVPEKYGSLIKKDQSVTFWVDNMNANSTFTASLYAIEPRVDENSKTIRVRAVYKGDENFYPGNFAKVNLNLGEIQNALMIPAPCLIATLKGQKVYACKNNTAVEMQVKIGARTDDKVQVIEGLINGDTIIVNGLLSVKKDSKLKLVKQVN